MCRWWSVICWRCWVDTDKAVISWIWRCRSISSTVHHHLVCRQPQDGRRYNDDALYVMARSMLVELGSVCELSITEITWPYDDRPTSIVSCVYSLSMKSHVSLEVVALCERAIADDAHVRPLPCVRSHVSAKIRLLRKRPTAKVTSKRTLSAMDPEVHCQHIIVSESAATQHADEPSPGPVIGGIMAAHVLVEIAALCEWSTTLCADVRPLAGMKAKVSFEVAALSKAAVANVADKWSFSRMSTFMTLQVRRLHKNTRQTCKQDFFSRPGPKLLFQDRDFKKKLSKTNTFKWWQIILSKTVTNNASGYTK